MELENIENKISEAKAYAKHRLKSWVLGLVAVLTSVAYIFYSMIKLEPNEKLKPIVITAAIIIGVICALITKAAYGEIGFDKGYSSAKWKEEQDKYDESCSVCLDYVDRVPNFYIEEEKTRKKEYRKTKLASVCLRYCDWFDEDGIYIGTKEKRDSLEKNQLKVLKKCISVNIYVPDMFKEKSRSVDNYTKKDKTDTEQRSITLTKNSITAILPSIVQVLFIPNFTGWKWAVIASGAVTVTVWTLTGLLQLRANYNFVTQEKVTQLRDKKELMSKFYKGCELGYYKNDYEAEKGEKDEKIISSNDTTITE